MPTRWKDSKNLLWLKWDRDSQSPSYRAEESRFTDSLRGLMCTVSTQLFEWFGCSHRWIQDLLAFTRYWSLSGGSHLPGTGPDQPSFSLQTFIVPLTFSTMSQRHTQGFLRDLRVVLMSRDTVKIWKGAGQLPSAPLTTVILQSRPPCPQHTDVQVLGPTPSRSSFPIHCNPVFTKKTAFSQGLEDNSWAISA